MENINKEILLIGIRMERSVENMDSDITAFRVYLPFYLCLALTFYSSVPLL